MNMLDEMKRSLEDLVFEVIYNSFDWLEYSNNQSTLECSERDAPNVIGLDIEESVKQTPSFEEHLGANIPNKHEEYRPRLSSSISSQYKHMKIDTIARSKANHTLEQQKAICQFMIDKYVNRVKGQDKQDIAKARDYLDWLEELVC